MLVKVHKEHIPIQLDRPLRIEFDGHFLNIELQGREFVGYFNSKYPPEVWQFWIMETGQERELPDNAIYLKTFMLYNGQYVLHVYGRQIK